jgi:predicted O-linked N-acetylglucosamine transferase (SPINDLY family)
MTPTYHQQKTAKKIEKILKRALPEFLKYGYNGTSMDKIAQKVGVSKQTLYTYFQDKEGLFKALVKQVANHKFQLVWSKPLQGEPKKVLTELAARIFQEVSNAEHLAFMHLLITEVKNYPEFGKLFLANVAKPAIEVLSNYLQQKQHLSEEKSQAIACIFVGSLINFILTQEMLHGKEIMPLSQANLVDTLIELINKTQTPITPVIAPENNQFNLSAKEHFDLANKLKKEENLEEAAEHFRQVIQLCPDYAPAYNNLGTTLQKLDHIEEAEYCYRKALEIKPNLAETYNNLASIYQLNGDYIEARKLFNHCLQLKPDYIFAWFNLACISHGEGNSAQAKQELQQALKFNPNYVEALLTLATIIQAQGYFNEAIAICAKVLKLEPKNTDAYLKIGQIREFQNNFDQAKQAYLNILAIEPDNSHYQTIYNYFCLKLADWSNYDQNVADLKELTEANLAEDKTSPLSPYVINSYVLPNRLFLKIAQKQAECLEKSLAGVKSINNFDFSLRNYAINFPSHQGQKIRLGYISPDLRNHAVGVLVQDLFKYHNRDQFTIYTYNLLDIDDEITQKIRAGSDYMRSFWQMPAAQAAQIIFSDRIDILIDLAGYTIYSRPDILALQPAPIQMQFMGYPQTMGAKFIQYILADQWLITPEIAQYYTEEVIYLPHAFVSSPLSQKNVVLTKEEFGLPQDSFVFCCFNRHDKLEPHGFALWMKILQEVPHSVLWLNDAIPEIKQNLVNAAQKHNIEGERLVFAKKLPYDEYLARYQLADLFLDTFIYGAGSTGIACLWGGVPLLTCMGETNASRMGASLSAAVNLPEMICSSPQEYLEKAIYWAKNPHKLQEMKARLNTHKQSLPLFDLANFVVNLEEKLMSIFSATR